MSRVGPARPVGDDWSGKVRDAIVGNRGPVHLVGVGNPIRSDDAVGLEVATRLRRLIGPGSLHGVRAHIVSPQPERLLSRLASEPGRIVVFDAVEASRSPGEIVCATLNETKYGFFATHNVPLRLVPGLADRKDEVILVGVQPQSLEVGEGLTDVVQRSVESLVAVVVEAVEAKT